MFVTEDVKNKINYFKDFGYLFYYSVGYKCYLKSC